MNKVMLCRHRRNRRRFLAAMWVVLILTHFVVFLVGGVHGLNVGFEDALNQVKQNIRKTNDEKAGVLRNVRDNRPQPSAQPVAF